MRLPGIRSKEVLDICLDSLVEKCHRRFSAETQTSSRFFRIRYKNYQAWNPFNKINCKKIQASLSIELLLVIRIKENLVKLVQLQFFKNSQN